MHSHTPYKRLERSQHDHLIGGVCSGIAHQLNIDPNWIRLAFLISFCFFLITPLVYCFLWFFIPKATQHTPYALPPANKANADKETTTTPLLEHTEIPIDNTPPCIDGELVPHEDSNTSHLPDLKELLANVEVTPIIPVQPRTPPMKDTHRTNDYLDNFDLIDGIDDFPEDFLASFNDETSTSSNKPNTTAMSNDFPDDFLASFNDEKSTSSNKPNTTPMSNDFPDDFLASFDDKTSTSTQDDDSDLLAAFIQSIQEDDTA